MKAVQIGIFAALLVCAGLLYKVYRGQQAAVPVAQTQSAPAPAPVSAMPDPVPQPPPPAVEPAPAPAPEKAAAPAHRSKKPSPARGGLDRQPELISQNRPPEPARAVPVQQPAVAETPAPPPPQQTIMHPEPAPPAPREPNHVTIAAGTSLTIRLGETLSTQKNQPGDTFTGTLDQPLIVDGFAIAERGSRVQGKIVELQQAGRVKGVAHMELALTRIHTADGQDIAVNTQSFAKEGPTSKGEDAKKVGVGAAIGAAIGAIAGGGKGAAIGAGVGGAAGAGTVAATRGKPVELPVETRLTFRLQDPVTITERIR